MKWRPRPLKPFAAQFDPALDIASTPEVTRTVIIASTPRSGSHMIGHAMTATNRMGRPFEYVAPLNRPEWMRQTGTETLDDLLKALMLRRTTPNGVFSIKIHWEHLTIFGGLDALMARFPNPVLVRVTRSDILRQAVSRAIAQQTGVWISGMEGNGMRAFYSRAAIRTELERTALENAAWSTLMTERGLRPLILDCDDIARNTAECLRRLATAAEIDLAGADLPATPPTVKQATGRSEDWVARYRRDHTEELKRSRYLSLPRRLMWRVRS